MCTAALLSAQRVRRFAGFTGVQVAVQAVGFLVGIVLVRGMAPSEFGQYTIVLSMIGVAAVLGDLGLAAALMARGGRLEAPVAGMHPLLREAQHLQRYLGALAVTVAVPMTVLLLLHHGHSGVRVALLAALVVATAWWQWRSGLTLSALRLIGDLRAQQRVEFGVQLARLLLALAAAAWFIDAMVAACIGLVAAGALQWGMSAALARHLDAAPATAATPGAHRAALVDQVRRQAPNSLYYLLSTQVAVWLIAVFGSAERVADVGALARLAALFALVGSVGAALVMPYFARRSGPAQLREALHVVNAFFALLLLVLIAAAQTFPAPMLHILGGSYAGLEAELPWMVVATTLAAWGAMLYGLGCARGWVLPFWLSVPVGCAAIAVAAATVDVASVRGGFIINAAAGGAGVATALGYLAWQLRAARRATS